MDIVTLKNGKKLPRPIVRGILHRLNKVMEETMRFTGPIVFYELVHKARNPDHKFFGESEKHLDAAGFLSGGKVQTTVQDIILACVEGDDLEMKIVEPA